MGQCVILRCVALLAASTAVLVGAHAQAADLSSGSYAPAPAVVTATSSWTGLYIGAVGGYGFGDWDVDLSHSSGAVHYNDFFNPDQVKLDGASGWLGGVQAGFDYQMGAAVIGIAADIAATGIKGSGRFTTQAPNYATWDINSHLTAFGTVRGRLGIANDNFLLYGTGGLAWGVTDTTQATNWFAPAPPDVGGRTSGTTNHIGYAVGAGVEWKAATNWSINFEYLFADLGKQNYALNGFNKPSGGTPYTETFATDLQFHTVKVGLNYRLGG